MSLVKNFPRKDRTELSWKELIRCKRILAYGAPVPSMCPKCGKNDYRYSLHYVTGGGELLKAQCRRCNYSRYWNPGDRGWTVPGGEHHNPKMVDDIDAKGERLWA